MSDYLSLTEYSAKYGVSVSTLRRKIKKTQLSHKKENGKYLIPDQSYEKVLISTASPQDWSSVQKESQYAAPPQKKASLSEQGEDKGESLSPLSEFKLSGEVFEESLVEKDIEVTPFNGELKESYERIISEQEQQNIILKSHIVDLQTLNRALESEIQRLKEEKENFSSYNLGVEDFLKDDF